MDTVRSPESRLSLPVISAVTFLGFLDTHLLIPVIAIYASGLGASTGIIGLVVGLYSLTNTPANILFGRLIDRVGYKVPLLAGLVGDALSMFLYSLCHQPWHLALVRILHGLSGGIAGPATMSATSFHSGWSDKARTMSIYGISLASATLIGYPVSGIIVSRLGYKALFLVGAGLVLIGALISLMLPGRKASDSGVKTPDQWDFGKVKSLLSRRGLAISYGAIFIQYFTFGGVVTLLPLYVEGLGMGAFHVGMLLAVFAIVFIIIQIPSGILSDRKGRQFPIAAGLCLAAVALFMLPSVTAFYLLATGMGLYGIAYGFIFPSASAAVADNTDREERGLASGIFHALLTAGVAIGAPLLGWLGGAVGVKYGLTAISGIMALAFIMLVIIQRR